MSDGSPIVGLFVFLILLVLYFLPALVAQHRGRDGLLVIAGLNVLIAWTVLGWIVLLIVAFTGETAATRKQREEHTALLREIARKDQNSNLPTP